MKRPRYVFNKHGTYHYQRDYPTKLKHLIGKKTFTYPLQLKVTAATELEIQKAALDAEEAYQSQLLLISNSDPEAMSGTKLERAAAEFLRKRGLVAGQFVKVAKDADLAAKESRDSIQLQADGYDYADSAIPEFEDIVDKHNTGHPLNAQEKVIHAAYMNLSNKAAAKPKTLGSLWGEYAEYRDIDPESRNGKKAYKYWNRWISLAGDVVISGSTLQHINEGMDAYVLARQGSVSSQTLVRELGDVTACLRKASRKYRFGWHIELPEIKKTPVQSRDPLEPQQQVELVMAILNATNDIQPKYGVAMLLYLQGGMMVSEVKRLRPDDIALDADIPHLKIVNDTKTLDRKRIVPIVLGLDLIRDNIEDTIKWLQGCTESAPSATLKKIMRRTIDSPRTSPHCLRHSFKINGQNAGVSLLTIASIAGWSDAQRNTSRHLLNYGSTGISQSAAVQRLYDDSLKIHKHLIDVEMTLKRTTNVIRMRR
ncbi:site-specific integrase [Porticoccaceae bacterium]|nr:site-specific integrase [Porticoccaceae bacterium]